MRLQALVGNLLGRVLAAGLVPASYPAERAADHEGRDFRVARREAALFHALGHEAAKLMVDGRLDAPQLDPVVRRNLLVAHADQTHAEVLRDDARIDLHAGRELVQRRSARAA
ncbi:hypothetical protein D3C78_1312650 [compost metagenome]